MARNLNVMLNATSVFRHTKDGSEWLPGVSVEGMWWRAGKETTKEARVALHGFLPASAVLNTLQEFDTLSVLHDRCCPDLTVYDRARELLCFHHIQDISFASYDIGADEPARQKLLDFVVSFDCNLEIVPCPQ